MPRLRVLAAVASSPAAADPASAALASGAPRRSGHRPAPLLGDGRRLLDGALAGARGRAAHAPPRHGPVIAAPSTPAERTAAPRHQRLPQDAVHPRAPQAKVVPGTKRKQFTERFGSNRKGGSRCYHISSITEAFYSGVKSAACYTAPTHRRLALTPAKRRAVPKGPKPFEAARSATSSKPKSAGLASNSPSPLSFWKHARTLM